MHHELDAAVGVGFAHGLETRVHEARERLVAIGGRQLADRPEHAVLDLVADLDHFRLAARLLEVLDDLLRVVVDVLDELVFRVVLPRLRRKLLRRVGPPVAVMEVDEDFEAERMGALCHLDGARLVRIATAARAGLRVVPDAQPDPVDAVVLHDLELVHLFSIDIIELRAELLHFRQHRHIRALDEILRQIRNRVHLHSGIGTRQKRKRSRHQCRKNQGL